MRHFTDAEAAAIVDHARRNIAEIERRRDEETNRYRSALQEIAELPEIDLDAAPLIARTALTATRKEND